MHHRQLGRCDPCVVRTSSRKLKRYADHLNTPRAITNQAQQVVWRWENQEPFGNNPPEENPSGLGAFEFPLRFAGQYHDRETGLFYNYFRDYDPQTGRYLQSDPIGLAGGINPYLYVDANPLSIIDPLGLLGIYEVDGVRFHAYPGPPAGGIEHARHGPGQSYHIHLVGPDGKPGPRISTETWRPLTPDDEKLYRGKFKSVCENLTQGEKKLLYRMNREVFHRGHPTLKQLERLGTMRGQQGAGFSIRSSE